MLPDMDSLFCFLVPFRYRNAATMSPWNLLFCRLYNLNSLSLSSQQRSSSHVKSYLWPSSGLAPTGPCRYVHDQRAEDSIPSRVSCERSRLGESPPLNSWSCLFWCSSGHCCLFGLEEHSAGSGEVFQLQWNIFIEDSIQPISLSSSPQGCPLSICLPSLYLFLGWPPPALHMAFLIFMRFA